VDDQLEALTRLITTTVGDDAVGLYLHGSATASSLRPASDIDLLLLAEHSLHRPQRQQLLDGLLRISGLDSGLRPVDLAVVVRAGWHYPPTVDFVYGEWLREQLEQQGPLPPHPWPDLAVQIAQARAGRAVFGPPPTDVLPAVPQRDLIAASVGGIPELLDELESDTRNVLLTLARIWATVATGRLLAKDEAAEWALSQLPKELRPVMRHAVELYRTTSYADERWPERLFADARPCADYVVARIGRTRSGSPSAGIGPVP